MSDPDSRQPARVFTVSADLSSLMRGYTRHGRSSILIPFELKARIEREAQEARARELEDIRGSTPPPKEPHWSRTGTPPAAAPDAAPNPAQGAATAPPKVAATAPTPPSTRSRDLDYEAERARLLHLSQAWLELNPETQMRVYEDLAPLTLIKRYGPPASEDRQRNADIFRVLAGKGPVRHRAQGAEDLKDLDTLARAQPHLREVVEFVRSQIQLARASQSGLYLPPILLVGPPGVGKTHFAQELATTMDMPVHLQAMDTDVTNAVFLGSDKKWSNSHMGVLFELIGMGTHANPMIILDELDKASKHHSGVTATQSLHSLLEPVSAGNRSLP